MKKNLTSLLFWLAPLVLLLFRDEILSLLALSIMGVMCIGGILVKRVKMYE